MPPINPTFVLVCSTAKKIRAADLEVKQENLAYVKTKESLTHVEKKLGAAEQNLEQARKAMDAHNKEIDGLNKDLEQVEEEKRAYENELASKGRYQGSDIDMNAKVFLRRIQLVIRLILSFFIASRKKSTEN